MLLLLLAACTATGVAIDEDVVNDGADADTDADADADTDADTDTDTEEPAPDPSGDYAGEMAGTWNYGGDRTMDCEGEAEFRVDGQGAIAGTAHCQDDWNDTQGDLIATLVIESGDIEGTWTIPMGWGDSAEIPVTGTWDGADAITLTFDVATDWYAFEGEIGASR